jgi:DNA-binding MarR family transcriptional regulator
MSDHPETEPYRLAASASHLLHRAEQLANDRFAQLVGDTVTLRQFAVLAAIADSPGLSQSDLVRATGVDRSTLADMMTRMEQRGWIERAVSKADARAHSVNLALAGRTLLRSATQSARAADAAILDLLPRTKARSFLNTLTKLAKLSDEAAEKADRAARRQAKREARAKQRAKTREKARQEKERGKPRPKRNGARKQRG